MTSPSSGGAVMSSASITHGASSGASEGAGLGGVGVVKFSSEPQFKPEPTEPNL